MADRLIAAMGHFFRLRLVFWSPWTAFLRTWDTILVVLGSRETPNGHTDAQMSVFNDFWLDLGTLLEHTLETILWFSVIWEGTPKKVSRSMFVVLRGWKWCQNAMTGCVITEIKTKCFEWFPFFYLFSNSGSRGWDLAHILMHFGRPGVTFSDFGGSWRQAWNVMIFQGYPGECQDRGNVPRGR